MSAIRRDGQQGHPHCHIASFFPWLGFHGIGLGKAWRGWRWAEYALHVWHVSWVLVGSCILTNSCLIKMAARPFLAPLLWRLSILLSDWEQRCESALYCFWTCIPEARKTSWPSKFVLKVTCLVQNCSPVVPGVRTSWSDPAWRAGAACAVHGVGRDLYSISSWLAPSRRAELFVFMPVPAEYCTCQSWHPNRLRRQKQEVFKIISHGPENLFKTLNFW